MFFAFRLELNNILNRDKWLKRNLDEDREDMKLFVDRNKNWILEKEKTVKKILRDMVVSGNYHLYCALCTHFPDLVDMETYLLISEWFGTNLQILDPKDFQTLGSCIPELWAENRMVLTTIKNQFEYLDKKVKAKFTEAKAKSEELQALHTKRRRQDFSSRDREDYFYYEQGARLHQALGGLIEM